MILLPLAMTPMLVYSISILAGLSNASAYPIHRLSIIYNNSSCVSLAALSRKPHAYIQLPTLGHDWSTNVHAYAPCHKGAKEATEIVAIKRNNRKRYPLYMQQCFLTLSSVTSSLVSHSTAMNQLEVVNSDELEAALQEREGWQGKWPSVRVIDFCDGTIRESSIALLRISTPCHFWYTTDLVSHQ